MAEPDGARAPDLFDLHECSRRISELVEFLDGGCDKLPRNLFRSVFQALLKLEDAKQALEDCIALFNKSALDMPKPDRAATPGPRKTKEPYQ